MATRLRMGADPQVPGTTCSIPAKKQAGEDAGVCGCPLEPGQWHPGVCKHRGAGQHKQIEA
eukprot:10951115-Lingulodinium_polyedra.AAC.1